MNSELVSLYLEVSFYYGNLELPTKLQVHATPSPCYAQSMLRPVGEARSFDETLSQRISETKHKIIFIGFDVYLGTENIILFTLNIIDQIFSIFPDKSLSLKRFQFAWSPYPFALPKIWSKC